MNKFSPINRGAAGLIIMGKVGLRLIVCPLYSLLLCTIWWMTPLLPSNNRLMHKIICLTLILYKLKLLLTLIIVMLLLLVTQEIEALQSAFLWWMLRSVWTLDWLDLGALLSGKMSWKLGSDLLLKKKEFTFQRSQLAVCQMTKLMNEGGLHHISFDTF